MKEEDDEVMMIITCDFRIAGGVLFSEEEA
jgi:hypothetical protein